MYLDIKNEMVLKFYEFKENEIDTIKSHCFQYGSLLITKRTLFNKNIIQKQLWPILIHLEFAYIEKIVYGQPYCDVFINLYLLLIFNSYFNIFNNINSLILFGIS